MNSPAFDQLDQSLRSEPPGAVLDKLAARLADQGDFRGVLDAMLLRARLDLGLPLAQPGALGELPEPTRTRYEDRYVTALREVGTLILATGEIAAAWAYFRAIGEKEPVFAALDRFEPSEDDPDHLNEAIDIALGQGVHPTRGFDLILDHHGTCSALTAFESLPPDETNRRHAATRLAQRLHDDLLINLQADLDRRGEPAPPPGADLEAWLTGRDDLFHDDAYHLDVSHLAMVIRLSPFLTDPTALRQAVGLTAYGQHLSPRLQTDGEPPFDEFYADHGRYLRALLGEDPDATIAHFQGKLTPPDPFDRSSPVRAQTLVRLLHRLGRTSEAFEVAANHLAQIPDGALGEPTLSQLGQILGLTDRLATIARLADDPVKYAALRLEQRSQKLEPRMKHGSNTD